MPKGTKVDKIYQAIKKKTGDKGKAARIAQAETGLSLKTGKKPKKKAAVKKKKPVGVPKNWNSMTETQKFVYSRNPSKKK